MTFSFIHDQQNHDEFLKFIFFSCNENKLPKTKGCHNIMCIMRGQKQVSDQVILAYYHM